MRLNKGSYIILYFLIGLAMFITIIVVYSSYQFAHIQANNSAEMQVWSHRGIHLTTQENTLEAFQLAKIQGFKGVELDVFYDDSLGLVVSHDFPYQLVKGKVLNLTQVMDTFYQDFSFWIDFKNLESNNVDEVKIILNQLFDKYPILQKRIFVESDKGWQLRKLAKSGIQGIYWVQFNRTPVKQFFKIVYLKFIIAHSNFVGITSDYRYLEPPFEKTFGHLNWYVFTVNSQLTIDELSKIPAVKVILTDLEGSHVFN